MEQQEHFLVDGREVVLTPALYVTCDGAAGALGHPVEYMTLEKGGQVLCKYCGRRYLHTPSPQAAEVRRSGAPATA